MGRNEKKYYVDENDDEIRSMKALNVDDELKRVFNEIIESMKLRQYKKE